MEVSVDLGEVVRLEEHQQVVEQLEKRKRSLLESEYFAWLAYSGER